MFWMLDFFCTVYLVWLLLESPLLSRWHVTSTQVRYAGLALLAACSVGRGSYVMWIENPERALIETNVPDSDWRQVMDWSRETDPGTNLLVDPGHAWRYGTSVRVAAQRDVFLEEVKDTGMAIFSRGVAQRVAERIQDIGDFTALTADRARTLAGKYELDYLITTNDLDLAIVHRSGPFVVHALDD